GVIVTILSLAFVFSPSVSQAFWSLQAMTAVLYMLMYIIFFTAARRARHLHPDTPRPFRVPAMAFVAIVGTLAAAGAIAIGFVPPAQFGNATPIKYAAILLIGVAVLGLPPQLINRMRKPEWLNPQFADSSPAEAEA